MHPARSTVDLGLPNVSPVNLQSDAFIGFRWEPRFPTAPIARLYPRKITCREALPPDILIHNSYYAVIIDVEVLEDIIITSITARDQGRTVVHEDGIRDCPLLPVTIPPWSSCGKSRAWSRQQACREK